jgi:hypothetical protein
MARERFWWNWFAFIPFYGMMEGERAVGRCKLGHGWEGRGNRERGLAERCQADARRWIEVQSMATRVYHVDTE